MGLFIPLSVCADSRSLLQHVTGAVSWTTVSQWWPWWDLNPLNCVCAPCISIAKAVQRTASMCKRHGVRALWDRRAVMKAGRRFCMQAILCSSNASPDDPSGVETQLWCLNGLRGASICNAILFPSHLKSYPPQDSFPVVPTPREQVCEIFALAILQLKGKIPTTASL